MDDIKVSVIVPVYNVEIYLKECLDSLLNQTIKEYEIICVDDGSTDSSMDILKEYASKDKRITVLSQQNQYAGIARNKGLATAKGEYVIFLDSDDFFDDTLLEKVYNQGAKTNADVVLFGARQYDTIKKEFIDAEWYFNKELVRNTEVFSVDDYPEDIFQITSPAPWTKMFRRQFLLDEGIQFQGLQNTNDLYATFLSVAAAKRISYINDKLVNYRVGDASSTQGIKDKNPDCCLKAYRALYEGLCEREIYDKVKMSFANACASSCAFLLDSFKTIEAKISLAESMQAPEFVEMGVFDYDIEDYKIAMKAATFKGTKYALEFYNKYKKKDEDKHTQVIKENNVANPLVSVIIPVYNVEKFLRPCLDSIVNQDLTDIELVCVNDGSPDKSMDILMEYANKDERIKVVSQENAGLSEARNAGMRYASGKYIYFMDSDDILEKETLKELSDYAEKMDLDIVYFDAKCFSDDEECEEYLDRISDYYIRKNQYEGARSGPEMMADMLTNEEYRPSVCIQMLKRAFVQERGFTFIKGILHEDNEFTFKTILNAKKTGHINKPYFNRRVRAASITSERTVFAHSFGYYKSYEQMEKEYNMIEDSLDLRCKTAANEILKRCLDNSRAKCYELPTEERYGYMFLDVVDCRKYGQFVESFVDENTKLNIYLKNMRMQRDQKNERLEETFAEKSEINRKLQQTYAEKSEINKKLKQAYADKSERGVIIKELTKELNESRDELNRIKCCLTFQLVRLEKKARSVVRLVYRKIAKNKKS